MTVSKIISDLKDGLGAVMQGPWVAGDRYTERGVYTTNGDVVASTYSTQRSFDQDELIAQQEANTAHIVLCNPSNIKSLLDSHEAMRVALGELDAAVLDGLCNSDTPDFDNDRLGRAREAARAALSTLTSEPGEGE